MASWHDVLNESDDVESYKLILTFERPSGSPTLEEARESLPLVVQSWVRILDFFSGIDEPEEDCLDVAAAATATHVEYACHYLQALVRTKDWARAAQVLGVAGQPMLQWLKAEIPLRRAKNETMAVWGTVAAGFILAVTLILQYARLSQVHPDCRESRGLLAAALVAVRGVHAAQVWACSAPESSDWPSLTSQMCDFVDRLLERVVWDEYHGALPSGGATFRRNGLQPLAERNPDVIRRAGGERRADKQFEYELAELLRSLGFAVAAAGVGQRRVDLTCIPHPALRQMPAAFLVDAKSTASHYHLPVADQRALKEYVARTGHLHDCPIDFVMLVSSRPASTLAARLQTFECELGIPVRYCNAEALSLLRRATESFVPWPQFRDSVRQSTHIMPNDFWRPAVDYYSEVTRQRIEYTNVLLNWTV